MVLDSLLENNTLFAEIQYQANSTDGHGKIIPSWASKKSNIPCVFWKGRMIKSLISEKFYSDVSGVVLIRYSDITAQDINPNGRILLSESNLRAHINHPGGYSAGALSMDINTIDDSSNPIVKGDTFTISGETGAPVHTISSTVRINGVTSSITFSGPLQSTISNNADVTITPRRGTYSIIYPDDIGSQKEVIMIPVKEFTNA